MRPAGPSRSVMSPSSRCGCSGACPHARRAAWERLRTGATGGRPERGLPPQLPQGQALGPPVWEGLSAPRPAAESPRRSAPPTFRRPSAPRILRQPRRCRKGCGGGCPLSGRAPTRVAARHRPNSTEKRCENRRRGMRGMRRTRPACGTRDRRLHGITVTDHSFTDSDRLRRSRHARGTASVARGRFAVLPLAGPARHAIFSTRLKPVPHPS